MNAVELSEILGDFPSFCSLLEIRLKAGGLMKFAPAKWNDEQRRFERERTGRDVVIKPRQIGFSTLELARDLHHAITRPGENVQVVVHDAELKEQLFLVLRTMAEGLKRFGLLPRTLYSTKTELVFRDLQSAVRIVEAGATERAAQKKGRSGTIHRLHATEIAFWGAASETWTALDAAVPDNAEVVIESTANGASGLFYEMVQAARLGRGRYRLHFFPWYQHRAYKAFIRSDFDATPADAWERKLRAAGCDDMQVAWWRLRVNAPEWGLDRTLQEFPVDVDSCFRVSGRQYIDPSVIERLLDDVVEPAAVVPVVWTGGARPRTLGELRVFEHASASDDYVIGADVAEGTGADASTATVVHRKSARTVAVFWSDSIEPGDFGLALAVIGRMYGDAEVAPERNNHGHAAIRALAVEARYPHGRIFATQDGKLGWSTDAVSRPIMVDELGAAIRSGLVTTPDVQTALECKSLVRNERGKVEARGKGQRDGAKDDLFVSWAIALAVRNQPKQEITPARIPGF